MASCNSGIEFFACSIERNYAEFIKSFLVFPEDHLQTFFDRVHIIGSFGGDHCHIKMIEYLQEWQ